LASGALLLNKYSSLPLKCQPNLLPLQMGSHQVRPSCWHGDYTDTEKGCWKYMPKKKHDKGEEKRNSHKERGVEDQDMNHYRIVKFSCFFQLKTSEAAPVPLQKKDTQAAPVLRSLFFLLFLAHRQSFLDPFHLLVIYIQSRNLCLINLLFCDLLIKDPSSPIFWWNHSHNTAGT